MFLNIDFIMIHNRPGYFVTYSSEEERTCQVLQGIGEEALGLVRRQRELEENMGKPPNVVLVGKVRQCRL